MTASLCQKQWILAIFLIVWLRFSLEGFRNAEVLKPPSKMPKYCDFVINKSRTSKIVPRHMTPPWLVKMNKNGTSRSKHELYTYVPNAERMRLGNQLFVYASLFGISWRNGRIPLWPDGYTHVRGFFNPRIPVDRGNSIIKNKKSSFVQIRERGAGIYMNQTERLPEKNVSLSTYLQSWQYFRKVEDQLRIDLTFRKDVLVQAERFLNASIPAEWRKLEFIRVAIHVRRGDYVTPAHANDGWPPVTVAYFKNSMNYFKKCSARVQFVVISDDIGWCVKNVVGRNVVYSRNHTPAVDLAIASLCHHAILTIGSYGVWAAWFANGITIIGKNFPQAKSRLSKIIRRQDYYRPEWVLF